MLTLTQQDPVRSNVLQYGCYPHIFFVCQKTENLQQPWVKIEVFL